MVRELLVVLALVLLAGGAFGIASPMRADNTEPPPDIIVPMAPGR